MGQRFRRRAREPLARGPRASGSSAPRRPPRPSAPSKRATTRRCRSRCASNAGPTPRADEAERRAVARRRGRPESLARGFDAAAPPNLPHWTEPPTGEVPAVLSGRFGETATVDRRGRRERRRPGRLVGPVGRRPRWRDQHDAWDDAGFDDASVLAGSEPPLGALDETAASYLQFDEDDDHLDVASTRSNSTTTSSRRSRCARRPGRPSRSLGRARPLAPRPPRPSRPAGGASARRRRRWRRAATCRPPSASRRHPRRRRAHPVQARPRRGR